MQLRKNYNLYEPTLKSFWLYSFALVFALLCLNFSPDFINNYWLYLTALALLNFQLIFLLSKTKKYSYYLNFKSILIVAIVARLAAMPIKPTLSDDYLRYIWDGKVTMSGINPYKFPPNHSSLSKLHNEFYAKLPYKESNTIYPPVAQFAFATAYGLSSFFNTNFNTYFHIKYSFLDNVFLALYFLKFIWLGLDIAVLLLCRKILFLLKRDPNEILWYALNPLVIIEIFSQGHTDLFWVLSLCLVIYYVALQKPILSGLAVGFGTASRIFPALIFPFVFKLFNKKFGLKILLGFAAFTLFFLPLFDFNILKNTLLVGVKFTNFFEFNGGIYYAVKFILDELKLKPSNQIAGVILNIILVITLLIKWVKMEQISGKPGKEDFYLKKNFNLTAQSFVETIFYTTTIQIILLSKVHVWYFVAPTCLSIFSDNQNLKTGWKWLVCFAPLTYFGYTFVPFRENYFLVCLEWFVFFILLLPLNNSNTKKE